MSFNVILQANVSDVKALDKELTDVLTLPGTLRDECDMRDPAIVLETNPAALAGVNYFTIPEWGRAYFLADPPTIIRSGLLEIRGHCDVLASFKTGIREQSAIVRRAESDQAFNLYLDDGSLKTYANPYVLTEPFPGGFTGASFVLAVAGSAGASVGGGE